MKTPTTLIIMDGFALREETRGNAIAAAKTPVLNALFATNPFSRLSASGFDVGLPDGQMGNSEVGHTNIGAGRVVFQDLPKITKAIQDGSFFENPAYLTAMTAARDAGRAVHIMGLRSDGGVHSHNSLMMAAVRLARQLGCEKVWVHCFMDGRDVSPTSGAGYMQEMAAFCAENGAKIATVSGRYYAMDRDTNWTRTEKAYAAMVYGESDRFNADPVDAVQRSYDEGVTDEFILPVVCVQGAQIVEGDACIFMNFRPDRARQLTRTLSDPAFSGFARKNGYFPVHFVCTTNYDATMPNVTVAFPKTSMQNVFGAYISDNGLTQLRIAETEKYAHVTFFFSGGVEATFPGEERCLVASPKVATYDLQPEMSAPEVCANCVERIESGRFDVVILNFANCDMVGHTGVFEAAVKAVETVDTCVGKVVEATRRMGGITLITADHGNADQMLEENSDAPFTAHTTNLVPFCVVGADVKLRNGRLADICPTMLDLLGLEKPAEMDGESLIIEG